MSFLGGLNRRRNPRLPKHSSKSEYRSALRSRLLLEPLEDRSLLSVTLSPITGPDTGGVYDVPSGKALDVPLTGTDIGNSITYTATSSNPSVKATVFSGNPSLEMTVTGTTESGQSFSGTMTFQLFQNLAPNTVSIIENLVNSGFYNDLTFYRIVPGFVIQGGANGSKTAATFDDEFNQAATFNSPGILAMANSGPNTNSSEIFVSDIGLPLSSTPQYLNYYYTAFGQLTSGFDIYNDIMNAQGVTSSNRLADQPGDDHLGFDLHRQPERCRADSRSRALSPARRRSRSPPPAATAPPRNNRLLFLPRRRTPLPRTTRCSCNRSRTRRPP